jgi:hypothetical protein
VRVVTETNPIRILPESGGARVIVSGGRGPAGPAGAGYVHTQEAAAATWTITHNLGRHPSVTVVDSGGSVVIGDVAYVTANQVTVSFSAAFSGTAYLN